MIENDFCQISLPHNSSLSRPVPMWVSFPLTSTPSQHGALGSCTPINKDSVLRERLWPVWLPLGVLILSWFHLGSPLLFLHEDSVPTMICSPSPQPLILWVKAFTWFLPITATLSKSLQSFLSPPPLPRTPPQKFFSPTWTSHLQTLSLWCLITLNFSHSSLPSVGPPGSTPQSTQPLPHSHQPTLFLVKSSSACFTFAPNSWIYPEKYNPTGLTGLTSCGPSAWPASPHFCSRSTFPKSETTVSQEDNLSYLVRK